MTDLSTDVLIVGSGPAGATMALALSTYGIPNIVVTRYHRFVRTPRAHYTNQRAMELLRDLGVEDQVIAQATPHELLGNMAFCESLAGEELGRLNAWQTGPDGVAASRSASPSRPCDLPQDLMEPLLMQNATQRGTRLRFSTEYLSHTQDADGVTVVVRDTLSGTVQHVRARYLYGADGAHSAVAADLGLPFEGQMGVSGSVNVVFEADLTRYVAHRPSLAYGIIQPGSQIGGLGAGVIRMVRPWWRWLAMWGYDIDQGAPDLSEDRVVAIVRGLVGDDDLEVAVDSTSTWTVNFMYAARNTDRRVFCGGDAVHRHPPSNGLGSNTSMQDSYNLAWKLALVLRGHADPDLLDTYEAERIPIAKQVVDRSNRSVRETRMLAGALGLLSSSDPATARAAMQVRKEDSPAGRRARDELHEALAVKAGEFDAHGFDLDHRYESDAVVPDGSPEPEYSRDRELHFRATSRPGAKVPHCWFRRGPHARDVLATLDLVGKGRFTVLTGIGGDAWTAAARTFAARTGVDIATVVVGPGRDVEDIFGTWRTVREIEESGCLLVRPDGYVGFRARAAGDTAADQLLHALERICGSPGSDAVT